MILKHSHSLQRIGIVFLIFMVLMFQYEQQKAEANPAALLLLTNPYVAAAAIVLIAGGVAFATVPSLRAVSSDFMKSLPQNVQDSLVASYLTGSMKMTGDMWGLVKGYLNTGIKSLTNGFDIQMSTPSQAGETTVGTLGYAQMTGGATSYTIPANTLQVSGSAIASTSGALTLWMHESDGSQLRSLVQISLTQVMENSVIVNYVDTVFKKGTQVIYSLREKWFTGYQLPFAVEINKTNFTETLKIRTVPVVTFQLLNSSVPSFDSLGDWPISSVTAKYLGVLINNTPSTNITTATSDYVVNTADFPVDSSFAANPNYDLTNRAITVPTNSDGTLVKNPTDIINNGVKAGNLTIGAATAGALTASQIDVLTGVQANTGTIATAVTSTTGLADPTARAQSLSAIFTTKFPFSLPWDLSTLVGAVAAEPVRPQIHINNSLNILGNSMPMRIDVDFAFLDQFIGFFRTFEILAFCGFLIQATRRLLGGAQ